MKTPVLMRNFLSQDMLRRLHEEMNTLSWLSETEARHEYFMAIDHPLEYTYGERMARTYKSNSFTPVVKEIMFFMNIELNTKFDLCFLNKYNNEKQHLGWHADDSPEIDQEEGIGVISIGVERQLWIKDKGHKGDISQDQKISLPEGSLFIMPAGFQKVMLHKIPKHDRPCGPRISLTFRKLKQQAFRNENE